MKWQQQQYLVYLLEEFLVLAFFDQNWPQHLEHRF